MPINKSVKFYTLSSLPAAVNDNSRDGCFINLKNDPSITNPSNPDGLYFCFNNQWKYLVNTDGEVSRAVFLNGQMTPQDSVCVWTIPYSDITAAGISSAGAVVFLRETSTGKQLIPDVVFNDSQNRIEIRIYSASTVAQSTYLAIVIGSKS